MHRSKASLMKRALITSVAAVSLLAGTAGPAAATSPGAGAFTGFEYAPDTASQPAPPMLCAQFVPTASLPLEIDMDWTGTHHGSVGGGTAVFLNTSTSYYASPAGTFSNDACTTAYAVPGTLTITSGSQTCSAPATYQRSATTVIEIKHTATCNGAIWDFDGGQEVCPPIGGCVVDPNASSIVEGVYTHS